jgi:hypothetical protein
MHHVWLDICAIDKISSSGAQEVINSMSPWYEQAKVCYVSLDDVPAKIQRDTLDGELWGYMVHTEWLIRG